MTPSTQYLSRAGARALLALAVFLTLSPPVLAEHGVLTLSRGPGGAETIELSLEQLAALPQMTIVTENEFSDGRVAFTGPLVRDVLHHLGLDQAEQVRFTAANDYFVEIPISDFQRFDVILAMQADGKTLSRREKGPLWLMYPISDHSELQDPLYIHRLIWQVVRIESL